jgi:hypothetical protein
MTTIIILILVFLEVYLGISNIIRFKQNNKLESLLKVSELECLNLRAELQKEKLNVSILRGTLKVHRYGTNTNRRNL